jgi:hypothetical protein
MRLGGAQLHQAIGQPVSLARLGNITPAWTPFNLGADLLAFWDAEQASSLTMSAGAVSNWADRVAAYALSQSVGGNKPIYSDTGLGTRPGVTFDGTDDYLELASVPLPTGASPAEIWFLGTNLTPAANATARIVFSYGGNAATTARRMFRQQTGGANRTGGNVGTGVTSTALTAAAVDFGVVTPSIIRMQVGATQSQIDIDNNLGTSALVIPGTGTTRVRMGASTGDVASGFFNGPINAKLVTNPLSAAAAALLYAYLNARRN